jgi:hypothetical protein
VIDILTIEFSIERKIRADPTFVFDWWTDLEPQDSKLVKPLKARKILSKTSEKIILRDEEEMYFNRMEFDVEVTLHRPESWISEYDGKTAMARSEYRVEKSSDGSSTLRYSTVIKPKGELLKFLSPLVKPFIKRVFSSEMDVFIATLEKEYAGQRK